MHAPGRDNVLCVTIEQCQATHARKPSQLIDVKKQTRDMLRRDVTKFATFQ